MTNHRRTGGAVGPWRTAHAELASQALWVSPTARKGLEPDAIRRVIGVALVALSVAYLCLFVPRGWIPHDEGMIGQSAERVLAGATPHVDYEEPYTGGLTWLHAVAFKAAGVDLIYPRWLLFAGAALAQVLTYLILRRYLDPIGAASAPGSRSAGASRTTSRRCLRGGCSSARLRACGRSLRYVETDRSDTSPLPVSLQVCPF